MLIGEVTNLLVGIELKIIFYKKDKGLRWHNFKGFEADGLLI